VGSPPLCGNLASVGRSERRLPPAVVFFGEREWGEEVGRLAPTGSGRAQAKRARRQIEAGSTPLTWRPCEAEGPGGTRLPGCRKLYVPLDGDGPAAAPYGFVFQLARTGRALVWNFLAFGERHPDNPNTRNVYDRAIGDCTADIPESVGRLAPPALSRETATLSRARLSVD
jgi:hypothetical protein